jgi:MFS family permease
MTPEPTTPGSSFPLVPESVVAPSLIRRVLAARSGLPENVRTLGWVSLANDAASELVYPLLPLFLVLTLGAPIIAVGLVDGVPEAVASFARFASGWLSDRSARRRRWIFAGYAISSVARVMMAAAPAWGVALGARAIDRVGKGARQSARDALIQASSEKGKAGASFGYHRSMDTVGAVIGPLAAAALLAYGFSIRTALWVAVVPGLITIVLVRRIREVGERDRPARAARPFPVPIRSLPATFWRAAGIWTLFSIGNSSDVFLLLRARVLGLGSILIVLAYALYNIFYSALSWPLGSISDRVPRPAVLSGGMALFAAVYLGFAVAPTQWMVYPLFCLYGAYIAATEGVAKAWIGDHVDHRALGTAYGVFGLGTGLTALGASLLAGILWVEVAPSAPFFLGAVSGGLAALLLLAEWRLGAARTGSSGAA